LLVVGVAALFRLEVLGGRAEDNADTWRYLWEGRVLLAGMNPYAAPPASPRYDALRDRLRQQGDDLYRHLRPAWNGVRSVYGPVATGLFTLPHLLPFERCWSLRATMACLDLATALVIVLLLRALGHPPVLAVIYAWNPVCLDAFADRAHIDAAMVLLLALAAYLAVTRRIAWAALAFAAAVLVKASPLLLALPFCRHGRTRFAAVLAAALALGALPYLFAGRDSISGFREFGLLWQDNDSIHALVLWALAPLRAPIDAVHAARVLMVIAACGYAVWRTRLGDAGDPQWLLEACAAITGVGLLLSPVVFPWYTPQLLVFLCFAPSLGWLLLTGASMSWYLALWSAIPGSAAAAVFGPSARFTQPWRWVTYPPVYALLFVERWRQRRAQRRATAGPSDTPGSPWPPPADRRSVGSRGSATHHSLPSGAPR
jgi:hypothetical protein